MDDLRRLLNDWDLIGVRDFSAHDDEYDCLLGPLLTSLAAGADVDEIAAYLRQEIEGHFGLDPGHVDVDDFAGRAVTWWRSGSMRSESPRGNGD